MLDHGRDQLGLQAQTKHGLNVIRHALQILIGRAVECMNVQLLATVI